jgi:hypothetical protein
MSVIVNRKTKHELMYLCMRYFFDMKGRGSKAPLISVSSLEESSGTLVVPAVLAPRERPLITHGIGLGEVRDSYVLIENQVAASRSVVSAAVTSAQTNFLELHRLVEETTYHSSLCLFRFVLLFYECYCGRRFSQSARSIIVLSSPLTLRLLRLCCKAKSKDLILWQFVFSQS